MIDINRMLDKAQRTCSPANGNGLAAALSVKPSAVSNWKHGRAYPDVVSCERIARMIGEPPLRVIAQVNELRAVSNSERAVWKRLASAAAMFLMVAAAAPLPSDARVGAVRAGSDLISRNTPILSIMSALAKYCDRLGTLIAGHFATNENSMLPLPA